MDMARPP
ncbi:hypothetical protein Nmel_009385 [Mimus melanotis]